MARSRLKKDEIHVFRCIDEYGDGLVFTNKKWYEDFIRKSNFQYLGTLKEFLTKVKKLIKKEGVVRYYYIE